MNPKDNDAKSEAPAASVPGPSPEKPSAGRAEASEDHGSSWFWELIRTWGPAILAVILIRTFIFEPFRIPSGSMVPTLLIGDHVVVTKFSYGIWLPFVGKELIDLGDPQKGDIIVFRYPVDERVNYIKRVVAVPGDEIRVENNRIFINGDEMSTDRLDNFTFVDDDCHTETKQHYTENLAGLRHPILTNTGPSGYLSDHPATRVPPGHVFVMGDNRDNSEDSRKWGFVRFDQIKGKAHRIWLSWNGCSGSVGSIRTERFLRSLYE